MTEVEHILQWSRDYVKRAISYAADAPAILDEAKDEGHARHTVINEVGFGVWRNHQQRLARTVTAAALCGPQVPGPVSASALYSTDLESDPSDDRTNRRSHPTRL
jgi:hypothetical protein